MKYLVELNSPNIPADFIMSELHLEFGRSPEPTGDPDILSLRVDEGQVKVLVDYDHNRVWITIETLTGQSYKAVAERVEALLDRSKSRGYIEWNQIEIDN